MVVPVHEPGAGISRHGYLHRVSGSVRPASPRGGSAFSEPPRRWCTSLAVVAEAYGWFLHRLGEEAARVFRLAIRDLPRLELVPVDVALHAKAHRKLEALRGHKLTYVDAASLVLLAKLRIREVWGTDRDLAIEGARVIPMGG